MTIRVLQGDCREVLRTLPDASVQCVVTSPPYYGLRDYGVTGQLGLEATPNEYVAQMVAVFREVRRVLRDDGTCWLNLGDSYASGGRASRDTDSVNKGNIGAMQPFRGQDGAKPKDLLMMPARVALALQADGWWLRSDIIWHKTNGMPESASDRPTSSHEHVFLLTKASRYFYDAHAVREDISESMIARWGDSPQRKRPNGVPTSVSLLGENTCGVNPAGRNMRNVWTMATEAFPGAHFATMPTELAERCIKAGTSERGCCAKCGAPWVRTVTKGEPDWEHRAACGADSTGGYHGQSTKGHDAAGVQNASDVKRRILEGMRHKTFDWSLSCKCNVDVAPCQVLDPFGGSGTTALVADRLGRDAILIELNSSYCAMAQNRISSDAGMFAMVAAE